VLAVLAKRHDRRICTILERLWPFGAGAITCDDLSRAGWRFRPDAPDDSVAVIDGRIVPCREITGILTCWPFVDEAELGHVVPSDRAYVAAEMHAFLKAWLTAVPCPVLNRPAGDSLAGPLLWPARWSRAAAEAGLTLPSSGHEVAARATVTVIGRRSFGDVDARLVMQARALADRAGVDRLEVRFDGTGGGAAFAGACAWPRLETDEFASAIVAYFADGNASHAVKTP
jgi:hypothetical protein